MAALQSNCKQVDVLIEVNRNITKVSSSCLLSVQAAAHCGKNSKVFVFLATEPTVTVLLTVNVFDNYPRFFGTSLNVWHQCTTQWNLYLALQLRTNTCRRSQISAPWLSCNFSKHRGHLPLGSNIKYVLGLPVMLLNGCNRENNYVRFCKWLCAQSMNNTY